MGLFKQAEEFVVREIPELTLDAKKDLANRKAAAALGLFTSAAVELEAAADELDAIAEESQLIADEAQARAEIAALEADLNRGRADRIRNFLS